MNYYKITNDILLMNDKFNYGYFLNFFPFHRYFQILLYCLFGLLLMFSLNTLSEAHLLFLISKT